MVFTLAAAWHVTAMAIPSLAATAYPSAYPAWRHIVFIQINLVFAWLFLLRPRWFIWPYILLVMQVVYSHGTAAWALWHQETRVDWISLVVIAAALVGLSLLIQDRRG